MGHNATVVFDLDGLHEVRGDPHIGEKISTAIGQLSLPEKHRTKTNIRVGGMSVGKAIESHHADYYSILAIGNNGAVKLSSAVHVGLGRKPDDTIQVELLRNLADQMGYHIRKKPQRK